MRGGVYCGGVSEFFCSILDTVNESVPRASVSIGIKNKPSDVRGHVVEIIGIVQDDTLVYTVQDATFNYSLILRSNPNRLADIQTKRQTVCLSV